MIDPNSIPILSQASYGFRSTAVQLVNRAQAAQDDVQKAFIDVDLEQMKLDSAAGNATEPEFLVSDPTGHTGIHLRWQAWDLLQQARNSDTPDIITDINTICDALLGTELVFDGGMFVNGGFEDALNGWLLTGDWTARIPEEDVINLVCANTELLYQNFTLDAGYIYQLQAELKGSTAGGGATFISLDVDTGVDITTGVYEFTSPNTAGYSMGILANASGGEAIVDNMRLVRVEPPANVVTYLGEPVTYNTEYVTYD
ncbi:MAG: hypothetical protein DRP42_06135 [Tenericutes bacterium]|nr:MAG: hypothetical protein DRP42_06135 [Mycoplasmatota bacterium]